MTSCLTASWGNVPALPPCPGHTHGWGHSRGLPAPSVRPWSLCGNGRNLVSLLVTTGARLATGPSSPKAFLGCPPRVLVKRPHECPYGLLWARVWANMGGWRGVTTTQPEVKRPSLTPRLGGAGEGPAGSPGITGEPSSISGPRDDIAPSFPRQRNQEGPSPRSCRTCFSRPRGPRVPAWGLLL